MGLSFGLFVVLFSHKEAFDFHVSVTHTHTDLLKLKARVYKYSTHFTHVKTIKYVRKLSSVTGHKHHTALSGVPQTFHSHISPPGPGQDSPCRQTQYIIFFAPFVTKLQLNSSH